MSQHDLDIANQGFPATRSDLNLALKALGSSNSGASAPSTTYANQLWYDTANNILKIRNEDNDAWISLFTLDQSADAVTQIDVDNIRIDGNTISSTDTNGDISLSPNGTGAVEVSSSSTPTINIKSTDAVVVADDVVGAITFEESDATGGTGVQAFIKAVANDSGNTYDMSIGVGGNTEAIRVDQSGNVGINNASPAHKLHVHGAAEFNAHDNNSGGGGYNASGLIIGNAHDAGKGSSVTDDRNSIIWNERGLDIDFGTTNTYRMKLDYNGNVLVATTDAAPRNLSSGGGIRLASDGAIEAAKSLGQAGTFNRTGNDGDAIVMRRDGSTKGTVGINGGNLFIRSFNVGLVYQNAQDRILPCTGSGAARDNAIDLGEGGARFDDIFATNGSIQTSDQNEKQDIASLTTAEITAAKAISKLFKTFKWRDKVAAKGDAARTHSGVIAQEVQAAMTDAGLYASNYAFWCSNTWWETSTEVAAVEAVDAVYEDVVIPAVEQELDADGSIIVEAQAERTEQRLVTEAVEAEDAYTRIDTYHTADDAPEGATQRTRMGIRYPELLAFIGAATEQRLGDIETRLAALEA
jgi:hypothetical protein